MDHDLIIRGGRLADGTGAPLREADIAVRDGLISAIAAPGTLAGTARETIDATGLLVTPGFVDIHTHYDGQAVWDERLQPSSWHGVTTAVMGNCGVGFAPVRTADHARLIELMEGVEDIPGAALHEGLSWQWESFGQYLDAVAERPHDMDIAAHLPHGALRVYVMGERGARLEEATPDDIARMRALAGEAVRAGAIGFSTSRSLNHRSIKGEPTPGLRATEAELTGIALGLRDAGRGVLQFISDFDTPSLDEEFAMLRRVVAASGRPMSFSLAQRHSSPKGFRKLLALVAQAQADGLPIRAQVAPRPVGVLLGLQGSRNPFSSCPAFIAIAHLPLAERVALLRQPALRAQLLQEIHEVPATGVFRAQMMGWARMFPMDTAPDYEPPADQALAAIAEREGKAPAEVALDWMLRNDGHGFLFSPFANYAEYNLDACREMLADPHTVVGLGDGGAHVSIISDGSFPTYLLTHWGRDRPEGRFDIAWLVKRQTLDTARAVGLLDRGLLAPGYRADINVIDFDRLALAAPEMANDLPANGPRLLQRASGYVATLVNGVPVYREGVPTGALPGRLVRGAQRAPVVGNAA